MSQPFLGEIRPFAFEYAPKGWAKCRGQLLAISTNNALFSLLGTMYGGNGAQTFGLPNLQGRVAIGFGTSPAGDNYLQGELAGEEAHTLILSEIPAHTHQMMASNVLTTATNANTLGTGKLLAKANALGNHPLNIYGTEPASATLGFNAIMPAGGGQPHENRQPLNTFNFCIALQGIYPSRN